MGGPSRARLGLLRMKTGDFAGALEFLDAAISMDPDDITSRRRVCVCVCVCVHARRV